MTQSDHSAQTSEVDRSQGDGLSNVLQYLIK